MVQFDDTFSTQKMAELRRKEEEDLIRSLADQYGLEFVDLRGVTINPSALKIIDETTARNSKVMPFELTRKKISLAIRNPNNDDTKEIINSLRKEYSINLYMTSTASLEHGWERYADAKDTAAVKHGVFDIDTDNISEQMQKLQSPGDVSEYILGIRTLNSARRISETMEAIFAGALALGASDVHIEPEDASIRLRYRLDGVLHDIIDLDRMIYERLLSRLKLLSGMILNIRNEAQDGRFTFTLTEKEIEVRSSVIPGASGESMVMRLLDPTVASFSMSKLGLNSRMEEVLTEELSRPNGMIVTTGPTGSGKTTALYAFLQEVHEPGKKIITIENPVEYKLDDIVQTQVDADYTFEKGLRAVLRQDPDIIMVGEVRDREVAETAMHAAQTGHLVFTTLHTNSAVGAFSRIFDLGVDPQIVGSTINVILGQRLVRILCEHCREAHQPDSKELDLITNILATHPLKPTVPENLTIFEPGGCTMCNNSGFSGRQAVFEAIRIDEAVEAAVLNDPREHIILDAAKNQGIPTMAEDGIEKVIAGVTSLGELRRVVDLTEGRHTHQNPAPAVEIKTEKEVDDFESHIV